MSDTTAAASPSGSRVSKVTDRVIRIAGNKVELTCDKVSAPIAVRYAWADNPVCNLFSNEGLPVTPFRTDDFEMITKPKPPVTPVPAAKK